MLIVDIIDQTINKVIRLSAYVKCHSISTIFNSLITLISPDINLNNKLHHTKELKLIDNKSENTTFFCLKSFYVILDNQKNQANH